MKTIFLPPIAIASSVVVFAQILRSGKCRKSGSPYTNRYFNEKHFYKCWVIYPFRCALFVSSQKDEAKTHA
jgi:hypothetical protein